MTLGKRKKMKGRHRGCDRVRVNLNATQFSTSEREVGVTEGVAETTERLHERTQLHD